VLEALAGDLGSRFGVYYQILTQSSPTRALAVLLARSPLPDATSPSDGTAWVYRGAPGATPT
jgi:hypothetical protein